MEAVLQPEYIAATVLGALGLYGFIRMFLIRKQRENESVNWSPLEAVGITIAIYGLSQVVVYLLLGLIANFFGWDNERVNSILQEPGPQFVMIAGIEALSLTLLYWFLKRRQTAWRAIGWVRPRWRDTGYALAGFVAYFGLYTLFAYNILTMLFPQIDTDQQQDLGFSTATTGPALIFVFLSLVILPPLVEEILVRGFLYTGLRNKLNVFWAAIVTSVVFGAAHLQWGSGAALLWTAAVDTFVLSLVLVALRQKTGSLWPGIGLHFIKNFLAFLALFVFKVG